MHLYSNYLPTDERKNLIESLEKRDFNVVVNIFDFPSQVKGTHILYSLMLRDSNSIEWPLEAELENGYEVERVSSLNLGNHWYRKDSLALFVLPSAMVNVDYTVHSDLVNTHESDNCQQKFQLRLKEDGRYSIVAPGHLILTLPC